MATFTKDCLSGKSILLTGGLGAIGKVGAFLSSDKEEYFVVAQADVKGAAFSPSHWVEVTVVA